MTSRVWVANKKKRYDYSGALRFGELVTLTQEYPAIFKTEAMVEEVKENLHAFEDGDYLLLSGSALVCGLAFHEIMRRFGRVQILLHNSREGRYESRIILESQFGEGGNRG